MFLTMGSFFSQGKAWKFASDTDLQPCALMMSFNMAQCEGEGRESVRIRYVMGCYFLGFISSDSFGLLLKKKKESLLPCLHNSNFESGVSKCCLHASLGAESLHHK